MRATTKFPLLILFPLFLLLLPSNANAQFIDDANTNYDLISLNTGQRVNIINTFFGNDVSANLSSISLLGGGNSLATSQVGFFTDLDQILPATVCDFSTGIVFSTGYLTALNTSNTDEFIGDLANDNFDTDFDDGTGEYDVARIAFDYTITSPTVFQGEYFFSSDEYEFYVGGGVNDGPKIFVNGVNYALTASGTEVSIDEINSTTNTAQYIDNDWNAPTINYEPNGFTVKLTFSAPLNVGVNSIKIGVADRGDETIDSWFFFAAGSFILLAAEIVEFEGDFVDRDNVLLNWTTASEENNDYFRVEHSTSLKSWKAIGEVKGAGSSQVENTYQFTHTQPSKEGNYYRLAKVDLDGQVTFSEIVSVIEKQENVILYPNPSNEFVSIALSKSDHAHVVIYDYAGTQVKEMDVKNGSTFSLKPGIYSVIVESNDKLSVHKLIIN